MKTERGDEQTTSPYWKEQDHQYLRDRVLGTYILLVIGSISTLLLIKDHKDILGATLLTTMPFLLFRYFYAYWRIIRKIPLRPHRVYDKLNLTFLSLYATILFLGGFSLWKEHHPLLTCFGALSIATSFFTLIVSLRVYQLEHHGKKSE